MPTDSNQGFLNNNRKRLHSCMTDYKRICCSKTITKIHQAFHAKMQHNAGRNHDHAKP